jgi:hypothetical protein
MIHAVFVDAAESPATIALFAAMIETVALCLYMSFCLSNR